MTQYETKLQQHKLDSVSALKELFQGAENVVFADYRGLSVQQITELRNRLREQGTVFKVVKNRYAKIAFKELSYPDVSSHLVGPTALALSPQDAGPAAKTLFEFGGDSTLAVKGGVIDGQLFDHEQMEAFSKLPGRDDLIAQLMSVLNAPVTNFLHALTAVPQKLVRTLAAVAEKKEA